MPQALKYLVDGTGAHYPNLTFSIPGYLGLTEDAAQNIGFFAQPGDSEDSNGLTAWTPAALYLPATTTGEKLEAAKKFLEFLRTPESTAVFEAVGFSSVR